MKNFESVIAFGDSHTAGAETIVNLEDLDLVLSGKKSQWAAEEVTKPVAFPAKVAAALGIPCFNYAMSGGSNDRSIRLLSEALLDHPNSLVLFCYTSPERGEFYYPDKGNFLGRDENNYLQVGIQWYGQINKVAVDEYNCVNPINDIFVEKILRINHTENSRVYNMMQYVELTCEKYALDYRHILLYPNLITYTKSKTWDSLDRTKILTLAGFTNEGYGCYFEWLDRHNFKKAPFDHFKEDAHAAIANKILETL
jgi:hypothetical protein